MKWARDDFAAERGVQVDGWLLGRTETKTDPVEQVSEPPSAVITDSGPGASSDTTKPQTTRPPEPTKRLQASSSAGTDTAPDWYKDPVGGALVGTGVIALGVGIGFGLQNVVNNFVSGLILIFERPIQVGDAITVDQLMGRVRKIGMRASTIRTFEGAEVIIPNGLLLDGQLVNWTLSDQQRRIDISVGVAYGTDPDRVIELCTAVAAKHKAVLQESPPATLLSATAYMLQTSATLFVTPLKVTVVDVPAARAGSFTVASAASPGLGAAPGLWNSPTSNVPVVIFP